MTADVVRYMGAVVAFAVFATAHLSLVVGLSLRPPRWRGPVSLLLFPLAPVWGFRERLLVRTIAWAVGLIGYAIALSAALSTPDSEARRANGAEALIPSDTGDSP